jgi:hypothetical protein
MSNKIKKMTSKTPDADRYEIYLPKGIQVMCDNETGLTIIIPNEAESEAAKIIENSITSIVKSYKIPEKPKVEMLMLVKSLIRVLENSNKIKELTNPPE